MDGILVINKEENYTSRDVVNIVGKKLGTRKVGHTGTLDPMATGVLVLCIGKCLKMCEELTNHDKEYAAEFILGTETDTLDITGNILNDIECIIDKDSIIDAVNSFKCTYMQEVPKYSAVKVNGKKMYEYARNNIEIELPKKEVTINNIDVLNIEYRDNKTYVTIKCDVSKGTYIRSLIRDIGNKLGVNATMTKLNRTRQGIFKINESYSLNDIENKNYKLITVLDAFPNIPRVIINDELTFKVKNGVPIKKFTESEMAFMLDKDNNLIALYKNKEGLARMYKSFI